MSEPLPAVTDLLADVDRMLSSKVSRPEQLNDQIVAICARYRPAVFLSAVVKLVEEARRR